MVQREGTPSACDYCDAPDDPCFTIEELANLVEAAFERHFTRTSPVPNSFQYALSRDSELGYDWSRDGSPAAEAIAEAAGIDDDIAEDIRAILDDRYGDFEMDQMGEETEFSSDSHYEEKGPNPAYSPGCVNGRSLPFWEGSSAA